VWLARPGRGAALAAALALAGATAVAAGPCPGGTRMLTVEDAARGEVLHRECVRPGARLTLEYVHSSEGVPVRGVFRVERGPGLVLVETAFAGFGPGLPRLEPGDDWELREGLIVARSHARVEGLRLRVGPATRHRLLTPAGGVLDLSALMGPGGPVQIGVE